MSPPRTAGHLAERRAHQRARARRRRVAGIVAVATVGAALLVVPKLTADRPTPIAEIGVARNDAECTPVRSDPAQGAGEHVPPGTGIDYTTAPPSFGPHLASPARVDDRGFYTPTDSPPVEALVHNLEHGYTIAWYTPDLPAPDLDALRHLAQRLRERATAKFIAAPWHPARGRFPPGTPLALSHWGTVHGYRQYCAHVSGQAVHTFMVRYPASNSPEPLAVVHALPDQTCVELTLLRQRRRPSPARTRHRCNPHSRVATMTGIRPVKPGPEKPVKTSRHHDGAGAG